MIWLFHTVRSVGEARVGVLAVGHYTSWHPKMTIIRMGEMKGKPGKSTNIEWILGARKIRNGEILERKQVCGTSTSTVRQSDGLDRHTILIDDSYGLNLESDFTYYNDAEGYFSWPNRQPVVKGTYREPTAVDLTLFRYCVNACTTTLLQDARLSIVASRLENVDPFN